MQHKVGYLKFELKKKINGTREDPCSSKTCYKVNHFADSHLLVVRFQKTTAVVRILQEVELFEEVIHKPFYFNVWDKVCSILKKDKCLDNASDICI